FQIIDDILGTFGDEKITGKPTDGDIREGKKTCLLVEAYNKLTGQKKEELMELMENPDMSAEDVQSVKDLYIDANVIESCKDLANKYFREAEVALNNLKPVINQSEREMFENLLKFVLERKF
ncbi:MAG: polyprenyl synthetase family protein, partial [Candidatus Hermodarchaeota archaeon]